MGEGSIIHEPERQHACNPGWYVVDDRLHELTDVTPGAVWRCPCGRTFVARYQTDREAHATGLVMLGAQWRPEGRIRRWFRERSR